jgi:transcriptional regulator with XRE-family HTH domain
MTKKPRSAVATRIREESKRQGIPQRELAEKVGLTQQAVSRRLGEQAAPISVVEAELFAEALNVSVAWLFGETETPARVDADSELVPA